MTHRIVHLKRVNYANENTKPENKEYVISGGLNRPVGTLGEFKAAFSNTEFILHENDGTVSNVPPQGGN